MGTTDVIDQRKLGCTERFAGLAGDDTGVVDHRPPLVLLHGLSFDRTMWRPMLQELRRIDPGRRVLALDLPGHGESTGLWCYEGENVGTAVRQAVQAAGLHSPVVVGHSYSGILATVYAARYPTRGVVNVDQPLQVAPFAQFLRSIAEQIRGPGFPAVWEMIAASMHAELLPPSAHHLVQATCRPDQDVLLGYWQNVLDRPVAELTHLIEGELAAVRSIGVPYHIVAGQQPDPSYRHWLTQILPQATITVWPDGGHFPHLAHPEQFAQCLQATADWPRSAQKDREPLTAFGGDGLVGR